MTVSSSGQPMWVGAGAVSWAGGRAALATLGLHCSGAEKPLPFPGCESLQSFPSPLVSRSPSCGVLAHRHRQVTFSPDLGFSSST